MPENHGAGELDNEMLAGRVDEPVHLAPYCDDWPSMFESEAERLATLLYPWITGGIHHVGSTAVPGLSAKPVIDIQVGVKDLPSTRPCIPLLSDLEYLYSPYRSDEMHWFCKPNPAHRTHHLHLVPTASRRFREVLVFRDYLRSHPAAAHDYEVLKLQLAQRFATDREAYTQAKTNFVTGAVRASIGEGRYPSRGARGGPAPWTR